MENNKKDSIQKKLLLIGMGFFFLACSITAVNVLILPMGRTYFGHITPLMIVIFALSAWAYIYAGKKIRNAQNHTLENAMRIAVPAYLAILFVIHLIMGYMMEYKPAGDNFMIYNGAQMLAADGNFDAYPDFYLYLSRFHNQWGFLLILFALYKLLFALGITNMFFPTVVVQALLYVGGMAAYFAIARRLRGVRGVSCALLIAATCFPLYLAAAVLYTDTFSMPFVLIALLFALRTLDAITIKSQLINVLLCSLAAAIGGQIKMTVAIVLIAAAIVFLLRLPFLRAFLCCAVMALVMGLSISGIQKAMVGPVLDPAMATQHHTPTLHWIAMSIPTGSNPYGEQSTDYGQTWKMMSEGASHDEIMSLILSRIKDRIYTLRYPDRLLLATLRKNAAAFSDGTLGMTDMLDDSPKRENVISSFVLLGRPYYRIYLSVCTGIFIVHLVFSALACLRDIRQCSFKASLLYISFFGMILFMLIWEAKSRYIFNFTPVLLLLSMGYVVRNSNQEGEIIIS